LTFPQVSGEGQDSAVMIYIFLLLDDLVYWNGNRMEVKSKEEQEKR